MSFVGRFICSIYACHVVHLMRDVLYSDCPLIGGFTVDPLHDDDVTFVYFRMVAAMLRGRNVMNCEKAGKYSTVIDTIQ